METMENNLPSATHQEKAKKMKKLRRWQIAISDEVSSFFLLSPDE